MDATIFLSVIVVLLYVLYKRWVKVYDHWKERGVAHRKPYPIVGNMFENLMRRKRVGEILNEICVEHKNKPIVGFYNFMSPAVVINSLDYAHIVAIKEFSHFMDRSASVENRRPIDKHLFSLTGIEWRTVRLKMTPVFTTGKLKGMLSLMEKCFENVFRKIDSTSRNVFTIKELTDVYNLSVRATCVFGIESDIDKRFADAIDELNNYNFSKFLRLTANIFFPRLATKLNLSLIGQELEEYTTDLLLNTIKKRGETGAHKNDFIQLLLQLKQTGQVEVGQWSAEDDYLKMDESPNATIKTVEITDEHLVAQSMVFLLAGLDVMKSSIILTLLEVAKDKKVYEKLRDEVDTVIEKHSEFSYQAIREMKYLDMCIKETLRLHPSAELGTRHCVKDFTFPDGTTVQKGTNVFLPFNRFHWDPVYFPEPMNFIPERFSEADPPAYLPFGLGPRQCIAMRFAMLEMKIFISKLVFNYDFQLDPKTELPVKFENWFFLLKTNTDVYLKLVKRR